MLKSLVKQSFRAVGLELERHDPLLESMHYRESPYLPRVHARNIRRILYFRDMVERTRDVPGDVVECGTWVGYGLLKLISLGELSGVSRHYHGFDSFEGFPEPSSSDRGTHLTKGFLATAPELLLRVLADGGVPDDVLLNRLHIVKGFFDRTLPGFARPIALLHLDCDLYESYRIALECLYDRVSPGGVIMFDEYRDPKFPGADRAIDEFFAARPEKVVAHPFGQHYVVRA